MRGETTQFTISMSPDLADQIDAAAARRHLNRSSLVRLWLVERLAQEPKD